MAVRLFFYLVLWCIMHPSLPAHTAGTPSATVIHLQARADYRVGALELSQNSNVVSATVAELLDLGLTWQNSGSISVVPGESARVLTFLLTNTGNGNETFTLSNAADLSGDDFDPIPAGIYLDSNANGVFEPAADAVYFAGSNDPVLNADASVTIFVAHNMPADILDGQRGDCRLRAAALTGSGLPGTLFEGASAGGLDAIVGLSGALSERAGSYAVSDVIVSAVKSATVTDLSGGAQPSTGAVMSYRIEVSAAGTGLARQVVCSDRIPGGTHYNPRTLRLNGISQSDADDTDAGCIRGSEPPVVTVLLGDLGSSSTAQIITFDVTID